MKLRRPTDQQRLIVLGRTGSGKSQFAFFVLSGANFNEMPYIVIDYKGEDLFEDIIKACKGAITELKPTSAIPKKPGVYYIRPVPQVDDEAMEAFLWRVWKQGNCGLFVDEGYALPNGAAFNAILTQGRTKFIPVIALYQRPVYMSRFAVAQADFFAVFEQNDTRDLKTTAQFTTSRKGNITVFNELPPYNCLWYDVGQGSSTVLSPAPDRQTIIGTFSRRLAPTKTRALV